MLSSFHIRHLIVSKNSTNVQPQKAQKNPKGPISPSSTFKTASQQGRSSEPDPRFTFHVSRHTVLGSEARTKLETVFNVLKIKNPQGLTKTLRIAPATHPRQFPRPRGNVGQLSRQVFWLMAHPTPRAFPSEDVNRKSLFVNRGDLLLRLTVHEYRSTSQRQWLLRVSSPFTAAGPRGTCTLFPYPGVTMWRAL